MRLVCPNCEAKYEVPEDAIPETGRDVQCANCGHAWYQMRARAAETAPVAAAVPPPVPEPVAAPERVAAPEAAPEPVAEPEALAVAARTAEPEPEVAASVGEVAEAVAEDRLMSVADAAEVIQPAAAEVASLPGAPDVAPTVAPVEESEPAPVVAAADATDVPEAADDAEAALPVAAGAAPVAYAVDDSVLAILREEAEREASARRAEASKPLEVQGDLGIEAAMPAARKVVADPAPSPAAQMNEDAEDKLSARRTRLPDVEEINSTLRPGERTEEAAEAMPSPVEGRSSFRKGFLSVMTFAILAAALYVSADALSDAVPALAGFLEAYVGFIDSLRMQLDGMMQSATVAINGT